MTENKKKRCIWLYFVAFAIPVLTMLAHMFLTNCYPFGGNTILIGDADSQYVPFLSYMVERFKNGSSLQFDWHGGLGYDYYATFFYYLASPFNLLMFLFGTSHVELGALVIFLVQIGGCGVTALYFFRHTRYNKLTTGRDMMSLLFASAYAMCGYILAYQYNFIWLISLMLTPLVLLGIEYMVDRRDYRLYFVSLLLTLITNFYFAWYVCIFAVIYFIDQHYDGAKDFFKKFLKFVCASVVAALCAAVVLVPCYLSILNRDVDTSWYTLNSFGYGYFGNIGEFFQGFFFAAWMNPNGDTFFVNNNYCGIFTVVLAVMFAFNPKPERHHKIKRIVELMIISVAFNWMTTAYVLQGFTVPHSYLSRFMFILIMFLLITALEGIDGLEDMRYRWIGAAFAVFAVMYALALICGDQLNSAGCLMATALIGVYYVICIVLFKKKSIKKISLTVNLLVLGIAELFVNAIISGEENYSYSNLKKINYEGWKPLYDSIETMPGERKTSWMGNTNTACCSDGSIFSSVINSDVLKLYKGLGMTYQKNGGVYAYFGTTPISAPLFNMRYVLTDNLLGFGGYGVAGTAGDSYIMVNEGDIAPGMVMPESVLDWDVSNVYDEGGRIGVTPIDIQNELTDKVMGIGKAFDEYEPGNLQTSTYLCVALGKKKRINDLGLPRYLKKRDSIWYQNLGLDPDSKSMINVEFVVREATDLYAYISDEINSVTYSVEIDGEQAGINLYPSPAGIAHIGNLQVGQRVRITVANNSTAHGYGVATIKLYSLNEDVVGRYYERIGESVLKIDSFEDRDIKGSVNAAEDGILYMSVPYFKGFKVYVDGKQAEIVKVGGAMLGVRISAGEHDIHITYRTYGLVLGGILSCIGVLMVLAYVIVSRKRNQSMIKKD